MVSGNVGIPLGHYGLSELGVYGLLLLMLRLAFQDVFGFIQSFFGPLYKD